LIKLYPKGKDMIKIIKEAVKNYLSSLNTEFDECGEKKINGFVSKIEIDGHKKADIYIVVPVRKLDMVSLYWFGDKNYDPKDLTNEIANLIVGNAKIIAEKKKINFNISTPEFLGKFNKNIEYDDVLAFKYKTVCFYILFKEK
jgi:hypothetical protein